MKKNQMKKILLAVAMVVVVAAGLLVYSSGKTTSMGTAKGFGGDVTVTLTLADGKIIGCTAEGKDETEGVGSTAIDQLPGAIAESGSKHYDIYAKVENEVVLLDDTTVDLTNYVEKEEGKGLSTNDYTTEDKEKLAGLNNYTHPSYTQQASGLYKVTVDATGHVSAVEAVTKEDITGLGIPAQDTTYAPATSEANGLMSKEDKAKLDGMEVATLEEVQEMLNEVFATEQA